MTKPVLTIGITYHNERELLTSCLKSILPQLNSSVEVLIYDDASDALAKEYVPAHPQIRILRGDKNIGPAKARNKLLAEANGEYVHFHDSDDWFAQNWLEKVSAYFGKTDAIFTEVTSHREGKLYLEKVMEVGTLCREKDLLKFAIESFILVPSGTYKKALLQKIGGYREDLWQSEDWDFHVRLALANPSYIVMEEPLVYISVRRESRSQNVQETAKDTLKAIRLLKEKVPSQHLRYLADKAAKMGSLLFQLNEKAEARKAFDLSHSLGPSSFFWQRSSYQCIAKLLGQEWAEKVGLLFRNLKTLCAKKHS